MKVQRQRHPGWGRTAAYYLILLAIASGCDRGPLDPRTGDPPALVRIFNGGSFLALSLRTKDVVGATDLINFRIASAERSPDGALVYGTGSGQAGWTDSWLWALDSRSLHVSRRVALTDGAGFRRSAFNGLGINGWDNQLTASADGRRLFIAPADNGDPNAGTGIAVLDAATDSAIGFIGPFSGGAWALSTVPPGLLGPNGAVAFSPMTAAWPHFGPTLLLLDPATLAVMDSANLSAELAGSQDGIVGVRAAPDGGSVYVAMLAGTLLRYDLATRAVTARIQEAAGSRFTVAPSGRPLYVLLPWDIEQPSSGIVHVYDADLNALAPIDLSDPPGWTDSTPPALNDVSVEADGTLLISAGASSVQLWGAQAGRIFVVDATGKLEKTIAIGADAPIGILLP